MRDEGEEMVAGPTRRVESRDVALHNAQKTPTTAISCQRRCEGDAQMQIELRVRPPVAIFLDARWVGEIAPGKRDKDSARVLGMC